MTTAAKVAGRAVLVAAPANAFRAFWTQQTAGEALVGQLSPLLVVARPLRIATRWAAASSTLSRLYGPLRETWRQSALSGRENTVLNSSDPT